MMPRHSRIVIPGTLHHVTQRGNRRSCMFFDDQDREFFLTDLRYYSKKYHLQIADYCLMDNHTHLAVVPEEPNSLSNTLKPVHMRYSQYLNRKFSRVGLNWQGRFFSSPLDEEHAYTVFQYIALNPVKAGMVQKPEDYHWSGARAHLGLEISKFLTVDQYWLQMANQAVSELSSINVVDTGCQRQFETLERNVHMNLPVGNAEFISELERRTGRCLRFRSRGRPRKG